MGVCCTRSVAPIVVETTTVLSRRKTRLRSEVHSLKRKRELSISSCDKRGTVYLLQLSALLFNPVDCPQWIDFVLDRQIVIAEIDLDVQPPLLNKDEYVLSNPQIDWDGMEIIKQVPRCFNLRVGTIRVYGVLSSHVKSSLQNEQITFQAKLMDGQTIRLSTELQRDIQISLEDVTAMYQTFTAENEKMTTNSPDLEILEEEISLTEASLNKSSEETLCEAVQKGSFLSRKTQVNDFSWVEDCTEKLSRCLSDFTAHKAREEESNIKCSIANLKKQNCDNFRYLIDQASNAKNDLRRNIRGKSQLYRKHQSQHDSNPEEPKRKFFSFPPNRKNSRERKSSGEYRKISAERRKQRNSSDDPKDRNRRKESPLMPSSARKVVRKVTPYAKKLSFRGHYRGLQKKPSLDAVEEEDEAYRGRFHYQMHVHPSMESTCPSPESIDSLWVHCSMSPFQNSISSRNCEMISESSRELSLDNLSLM